MAERLLIEAMAKHLPPSGASLRLLDVEGRAGGVLYELRDDLDILLSPGADDEWQVALNSIDAVVAYDFDLTPHMLREALEGLRPGGRLIVMKVEGAPDEALVKTLEAAGYVRILVEAAAPNGVLMRGEKPHTEAHTVDRVKQVAARDERKPVSRYVYLLVTQTPNKPGWKLTAEDVVAWQAVGVKGEGETVLLAFSSLPKAVEFMQPAVVSGHIKDVNKVAKFKWTVAKDWPYSFLLNPSDEILEQNPIVHIAVDPHSAEAPDE